MEVQVLNTDYLNNSTEGVATYALKKKLLMDEPAGNYLPKLCICF